MIEIHGLRVAKMSASGAHASQTVTVEDGPGYVLLRIDGQAFPAGLSPQEARQLAAQLLASAKRCVAEPLRDVRP